MELIIVMVVLLVMAMLAQTFGVDTRDGFGGRRHAS